MCEKKEASYAGLPDYTDNYDHIQNLIDQYNRKYGPGSGWSEIFGR